MFSSKPKTKSFELVQDDKYPVVASVPLPIKTLKVNEVRPLVVKHYPNAPINFTFYFKNVNGFNQEIPKQNEHITTFQGTRIYIQSEISKLLIQLEEEKLEDLGGLSASVVTNPNTLKNNELEEIDINTPQLFVDKNKENLPLLKAQEELIPECADRTALQLVITAWEAHFNQNTQQNLKNLESLLIKLSKQLQVEELESKQMKDDISEFNKLKSSKRFEKFPELFMKMYKQIVPLDIVKIDKLITEGLITAKQIEGKEIFLLMGSSGAGKSTCIQFFYGCKMGKVQVNGITSIQGLDVDNYPDLVGVKASPFAKSETLYIKSVPIDYSRIGINKKGNVLLVDSPGAEDSRGSEIDIANAIQILGAVESCKSVRLVIVLGRNGLGDRLEGLLKIVNILIRMLPNIKEYFKCIQYLFTKYTPDEKADLCAFIQSKFDNLNEEELRNETFVATLEDLLKKISPKAGGPLVVNPLTDEPKEIFERLTQLKAIKRPGEQFGFAISESSKNAIKEQMHLNEKRIANAILRSDFPLIKYKLDQIHKLNDLLKYDYIKIIFDNCTKLITKHINEKLAEVKKMLNRSFSPNNQLKSEDLVQFKESYEQAQQIDLIKHHLGKDAIDAGAYLVILQNHVQQQSQIIHDQKSLTGQSLQLEVALDKLKIVGESFIEEYSKVYVQSCEHVIALLQHLKNSIKEKISENAFSESIQQQKVIEQSANSLQYHIPPEYFKQIQTDLKEFVLKHLEQLSSVAQEVFQKPKLNDEDIKLLEFTLTTLKKASEVYSSLNKDDEHQSSIKSIFEQFQHKAIDLFNKNKLKIQDEIEKKETTILTTTQPLLEQLSLLSQVEVIKQFVSQDYYKLEEQIIGLVRDAKRDVDNILNQIVQKVNGVNYTQLVNSLKILQNAQWIDNYRPGIYKNEISELEVQISNQCGELQRDVMKESLDLQNFKRISSVFKKILDINEILKLKTLFPELEEIINSVNRWFLSQTDDIFQFISTKYSLEAVMNKQMKNIDYKKANQAYQYLVKLKSQNLYQYNQELSSKASQIFQQFEEFLKDYFTFILNDAKESHKLIDETKDQQECIKNAQNLLNRLKELHEVDKFEAIFEIFENRSQILNDWQSKLTQDYNNFSERLVVLIQAKEYDQSLKLLQKVKAMQELDQFTGIQKFSTLYSDFQKQIISNNAPANFKEASIAIQDYDFLTASQNLPTHEVSDNVVFIQNFTILKQLLNTTVEELLEQTNFKLQTFLKNVEKESSNFQHELEFITANFKRLENALKFVETYFNDEVKEKMKQFIEKTKTKFTIGFKSLFTTLDSYISSNNYREAGFLKNKIDTIKDALEKYIEESIKNEIDSLQSKLDESLKQLIQQFKSNNFYFIKQKPPKDILKKLSEVSEFFQSTHHQLVEIISDNFQTELNNIQSSGDFSTIEQQAKLKNLESYFRHLSKDLIDQFQGDITQARESAAQYEAMQSEELKSAILSHDFPILQKFYKAYKASANYLYSIKTKEICDTFAAQANEYELTILDHSLNNEYQKLIDSMKQFYEFKQLYSGCFQNEISKHYEIAKKYCEKQIKQVMEELVRAFTPESNSEYGSIVDSPGSSSLISDNVSPFHYIEVSTKNVDQECYMFIQILQLKQQHQDLLRELLPEEEEKIKSVSKKIGTYFKEHSNKFQENLIPFNIPLLTTILKNMQEQDQVLKCLYQNLDLIKELQITSVLLEHLKQVTTYLDMCKNILKQIEVLKNDVMSYDFIKSTKDLWNKNARKTYFTDYKRKYNNIKQITQLDEYLLTHSFDLKQIQKECKDSQIKQINCISDSCLQLISKPQQLQPEDCQKITYYYNNLTEIAEQLQTEGFSKQIAQVELEISSKIEQVYLQTKDDLSPNNFSNNLIYMKVLAEHIPQFKETIDKKIDSVLVYFKGQKKNGTVPVIQLALILEKDPYGKILVTQHQIFEGFNQAIFNTKTQRHGIDYILDNIEGDAIDKVLLQKRYLEFHKKYEKLVKANLKEGVDILQVKDLILKATVLGGRINYQNEDWKKDITIIIPKVLAYIFAIWTLLNVESYFDAKGQEEGEQKKYLFTPHPAQIVSIFRLLGIGEKRETIVNNLVQVGTGEGKSIILAITAAILGLIGNDISVACYSEYLSQRDYKSFHKLFEAFNLTKYIKYGTFNQLCEQQINQKGDIRKLVQQEIQPQEFLDIGSGGSGRPKVLLIDEVDVFFNKDFHGSFYIPSTKLSSPAISALLDYIWEHRNANLELAFVNKSQQFIAVCEEYQGWTDLFIEILKDLLYDVMHFSQQKYVVLNNKIGYQEQDRVEFNVIHGYKTLFAYYQEYENTVNGDQHYQQTQGSGITLEALNENKSVQIKCGNYSYAQIPNQFGLILGVSGTLKTLSQPELDVIENEYNITKKTYIPSVFGDSLFRFDENKDISIHNKHNFFKAIHFEIEYRLKGPNENKRVVLVFFESKEALRAFYDSPEFDSMREKAKVLTEEVLTEDKDCIVRLSTIAGQVTLVTKAFGRGTDFKCNDESVAREGGIHVITTFLSEEISEEIQIKGRTARQGDSGSFSMVLLESSLEKYLITKEEIQQHQGNYYMLLNGKRNAFFQGQYQSNNEYVQKTKELHAESEQFLNELFKNNKEAIKKYLIKFNEGTIIPEAKPSRTMLVLDGTNSMQPLIGKTKDTIQEMLSRTSSILKQNGIEEGRVQLQVAVYRNYNSYERILEHSAWETKANNLRSFMSHIVADSGWQYEAIEIGLEHANNENKKEAISQVILIGDAPSNKAEDTIRRRKTKGGEEYWSKSPFPVPTSDDDEIQKLKEANIPVHAFYVHEKAKQCFTEYATKTGGRVALLDVNSKSGAKILTDLVTEEILRNVGKENGKGEDLVAQYHSKYGKSYN